MTEANLDPYERPLGGQLERDARLLAANIGLDLTAGAVDNTTRDYWCARAREAYEQLGKFGRTDDVADFATQAQNLQLVTAQMNATTEQVDAALGHRYHTPSVHFSIPAVADKAAAELKALEDRRDAALALHSRDDDGDCRGCGVDAYGEAIAWPCATRAALQGDQVIEGGAR